ncbi:MAG: hypothetical protein UT24_C0015G0042 [Candidatus Woesebacteria bacterium GW2011_GWB1_39_12]|uniref:Uncharacterized protein n=1 Tax=Candidatus Woesebacteria bacterium GW2011_GWB1_39_12 TaxID=1618574 RepID=A0A0G0M7Y1_9BACT|nr:MAG: hypothetical protein UT24_C0015G0042 [Candidatus Woesebacteria bacterium GW2011_GWB1_39_12]
MDSAFVESLNQSETKCTGVYGAICLLSRAIHGDSFLSFEDDPDVKYCDGTGCLEYNWEEPEWTGREDEAVIFDSDDEERFYRDEDGIDRNRSTGEKVGIESFCRQLDGKYSYVFEVLEYDEERDGDVEDWIVETIYFFKTKEITLDTLKEKIDGQEGSISKILDLNTGETIKLYDFFKLDVEV